jgi:DNA polymerase III subunit delta'
VNELLPWHQDVFSRLQQQREQGRLPHALLLTGPAGTGKQQLAGVFARSLLCEQPQAGGIPCGQCHGCTLYAAASHPDLHILEPAEDSRVIKIDQVRELIESLSMSSHYGRAKVVIVAPADSMNVAASNALLKTLEEPPGDTVLLLVSARPSFLPATIRSRCQLLRLPLPGMDQARTWLAAQLADSQDVDILLALTAGAPLAARQAADEAQLARRAQMLNDWQSLAAGQADPVQIAAKWVKPEAVLPISWMYGWVADMIRLRKEGAQHLLNRDASAALLTLARQVDLVKLYDLLDRILEGLRLTSSQVNPQTIVEGLLLYWSNMPRSNSTTSIS